jgi:PAP2 superfamily
MKALIRAFLFVTATVIASAVCADINVTSPSQPMVTLTWNQIALESIQRSKPTQQQAFRLMAYLSLAQLVAITREQSENRPRDITAAASMRIISDLFPTQAQFVEQRYRELNPQGSGHDRGVSRRVLKQARKDGFTAPWEGQAPQAAYVWRSLANPPAPPSFPGLGSIRTFYLEKGDEFRPGMPPAIGTPKFANDLAEVRSYTQSPTSDSMRLAKFYDMTTGTLVAGFWNEKATELIRSNAIGELQSATVLAAMNTAMMDALIACHDAKYAYWVPRPKQVDPTIKPLIGVPNHPSYPSNHSCVSTTAARVLSHFFPQAGPQLLGIASEAGLSRIYAGLHFRFDVEAGEEIGRKVSTVATARHPQTLLTSESEDVEPAK